MQLTIAQTVELINSSSECITYVCSEYDDFDDVLVQDKIDIIEICVDAIKANRGVSEDDFNSLDTIVRDDICDWFEDKL